MFIDLNIYAKFNKITVGGSGSDIFRDGMD